MIYLVAFSLYLIGCISIYAIIKFGGREIKSARDVFAVLGSFVSLFVLECLLFFATKLFFQFVIVASAVFVIVSGIKRTDIQNKESKWWDPFAVFVLYSILSPITVPWTIVFLYFDLDKKEGA
jgi:hypothetical protein